jgi:hypothetical protein
MLGDAPTLNKLPELLTRSLIPGELSRGRWHGGGMMVDDEPMLAALDVGEAVARGQALRLSIT